MCVEESTAWSACADLEHSFGTGLINTEKGTPGICALELRCSYPWRVGVVSVFAAAVESTHVVVEDSQVVDREYNRVGGGLAGDEG